MQTASLVCLVFLVSCLIPNILAQVYQHESSGSLLRDLGLGVVNFALHPNSRLNVPGAVILNGPSEKECSKRCTTNSTCFSFNFGTKLVFHIGDEPQYICELLPTDKYNSCYFYATSADFNHYSIQTECKNSPCPIGTHCIANYITDNYTCQDEVDECKIGTHNCDSNANCTNTLGSYFCTCWDGLAGDGSVCVDIDECAIKKHNCHPNAKCTNTFRSFDCKCPLGFTGDGINSCEDINECLTECTNSGSQCVNTLGSYTCDCKPGYQKSIAGPCIDIDECSWSVPNPCHTQAICKNYPGNFSCTCKTGYIGDGKLSCMEPIPVSVKSGLELEMHPKGIKYVKESDGINILVLNNLGYVHWSMKGFDTLHKDGTAIAASTYIKSIPNDKIVLMGIHRKGTELGKDDHIPDKQAFDQFIDAFKLIGSSVTNYSQIEGITGWSLIGYKGDRKPWIVERLDDTVLSAQIVLP